MLDLVEDSRREYREGDRVEFDLTGGDGPTLTGTIRGVGVRHVIDWWIVELDHGIESWPFSCVSVQHTLMRPLEDGS